MQLPYFFPLILMAFTLSCINIFENETFNQHLTQTKYDTELMITLTTVVKVSDCGFYPGQAFALSSIGNDEKPRPKPRNLRITYEKKAVDRCIKSILFINCPTFPLNTTLAVDEMVSNIATNRFLNCTFEPIRFFKFNKPLSGSFF